MFDHLEPFVNGLDALESVFQKVGFIIYAGLVITKIFKFLFGGLNEFLWVQKYFSQTPNIFYEDYVLIFSSKFWFCEAII